MSTRAAPARRWPRSATAPKAELQMKKAANNDVRYRIGSFMRFSFLCAKYGAPRFAVGIHPNFALVVEDHKGAFLSCKRGPFGKPGMIGIAFSREGNPGVGHSPPELARFGPPASHRRGTIGVVEDERKFGAVECARTSIQHRRLPCKPEGIDRRATESDLAFRLRNTVLPALRRERYRQDVERFRFGVQFLVGGDHCFSAIIETLASAPQNLVLGHFFVFRMVDAVRLLVEHRTYE